MNLLESILTLEQEGRISRALDVIYWEFDQMMHAREIDKIDEYLEKYRPCHLRQIPY